MEELTPLARLARHSIGEQDSASLTHAALFAWQRGIDTGEMRYALLWRMLTFIHDEMDGPDWPLTATFRARLDDEVRETFSAVLAHENHVEAARIGAQRFTAVQRIFLDLG